MALAALASAAFPWPAAAQFTVKDGQILGRTMGFVGDGMAGAVVVGVVFSASSATSQREATLIRGIIGDGLVAGRIRLQARLVPHDQLPTVEGIDALFLTSDLADDAAAAAAAARRLRVPTVSTDMSCVEAANCIVGFSSEPTVQIVIDREAADRAGVRFVQAFRMLVREK